MEVAGKDGGRIEGAGEGVGASGGSSRGGRGNSHWSINAAGARKTKGVMTAATAMVGATARMTAEVATTIFLGILECAFWR